MQLFDYSSPNIEDGQYFAGISYFPTPTEILGQDTEIFTTIVKTNEIYRPDKISQRIWQTADLSWVLDIINNFETGVKEYALGVEIRYVSTQRLRDLGLI